MCLPFLLSIYLPYVCTSFHLFFYASILVLVLLLKLSSFYCYFLFCFPFASSLFLLILSWPFGYFYNYTLCLYVFFIYIQLHLTDWYFHHHHQMPTLLTLTTVLTIITFAGSLQAFYIARLSQSWTLLPHFWWNFQEVSGKSSLFPLQNSPIWWYSDSMSTRKNLKLTQSDFFSFGDPRLSFPCFLLKLSTQCHLPPFRNIARLSLLAPSNLLKAVQICVHISAYVWESVCMSVCICLCMYLICFGGRGKVKKGELFLCADRKIKIIHN